MTVEVIPLRKLIRGLIRRLEEVRGKTFDFQNFDDRLIVQKIAYLLSKAGIIRGLNFNYYLRGPYSRELLTLLKNTRAYTDLDENQFTEMRETEIKLDPQKEAAFQKVLTLLRENNWDARWLELFTSGLFFAELEPDPDNPNWRRVTHILAFKKKISEDEAERIVNQIKKYLKEGLFQLSY